MFQAAADPTRVPFRNFNKQETTPTLMGNWVEERWLEEETGVNRYKVCGLRGAACKAHCIMHIRHSIARKLVRNYSSELSRLFICVARLTYPS